MNTTKKILIVHRDARALRKLVLVFAGAGFDVRAYDAFTTASDGARNEWFDVALVEGAFAASNDEDLIESLRTIQPTLRVLLLVHELALHQVVQGIRLGVADVVSLGEDPLPALRRVVALLKLEEGADGMGEVSAEEIAEVETMLGQLEARETEGGNGSDREMEAKLLRLSRDTVTLAARVTRLQQEKSGLEAELRTLLTQGSDSQRMQTELTSLNNERELIAATQEAIDEKARALGELRATIASERSALENERQRLASEAAPRTRSDEELAQERSELADWRRRLEAEDDRVAGDAARVRQETMQLTRERRRWHDDLEIVRAQEENLRAYEVRLRELQARLEADRVRWAGLPASAAPRSALPDDGALQEAWARLQRAGELLEAERSNFRDDRLVHRENEAAVRRREEQVRDREIRLAMREKVLSELPPVAPSRVSQLAGVPAAAMKSLTRAPIDMAKVVFGAVRKA